MPHPERVLIGTMVKLPDAPDALVRFDPKTEKFQSWAIPSGVGIIRHMSATPDQSSSNRIGLVTIAKSSATTTSSR